jgi:hypothetical protein
MFEHPTVDALSRELADLPIAGAGPVAAPAPEPAPVPVRPPDAVQPLDGLSEDELLAVLAAEIRTSDDPAGSAR